MRRDEIKNGCRILCSSWGCYLDKSEYFLLYIVALACLRTTTQCVVHCIYMCVCVCVCSAQMELLIEACAVNHCRTHYGNFQLEEPASVRAGSAAGWARAWLPTPAPLGRRPTRGGVQRTAPFIQHSSPGTRFHSLKPIFDYRRPFFFSPT